MPVERRFRDIHVNKRRYETIFTGMIFDIVDGAVGDFKLRWFLRSFTGNVRTEPEHTTGALFIVTLLDDTVSIECGCGIP